MPDRVTTVAVIGGGIAGLSLAWELARAGGAVTLFEAAPLGSAGASSLPVALLNPYRGRSARATPLDRAGLDAFWELQDDLAALGLAGGAVPSGLLRIPSSARQARAWRALADHDDALAWFEPDAVPAPLHAPFGALLVRRGGWVEAPTLLRALAIAARGAGAELLPSAPVEAIEHRTDGVSVTGPFGARRFDHAVLCVGAAPPPYAAAPPLERIEGDIVRLGGGPLPYPLAGAVYGAQVGAQVLVGGNHRPAGGHDPGAAEALRRSFAWFAPPLARAPIEGVWSGVRARQPGNRPLATPLAERVWLLGALAGRGFLCGPLLAGQLTRTLLGRGGVPERS